MKLNYSILKEKNFNEIMKNLTDETDGNIQDNDNSNHHKNLVNH